MPDKFGDKIRLQHAHDAIETDWFISYTLSIPDRHDNNCPYSSSPS